MLLTITLSLKNNIENFDITTEKGASSAFEFVGQNTEYKVLNIESDGSWANFNEDTILDEVIADAVNLKKLSKENYKLFIAFAQEEIHEPKDIIAHIKFGKVKDKELAILDEDEIWDSVLIGGVRKAVLY